MKESPEPITHPKIIPGTIYLQIPLPFREIPFTLPLIWCMVDWHLVLTAYDIE